MTVEAVVVMLNNMGNTAIGWEDCRKVLKAGDFITRVIAFDTSKTSQQTVSRIKAKYIDTEQWDADKIMRASKVSDLVLFSFCSCTILVLVVALEG